MTEAASADLAATAEKKRRLLGRVPTSLVVTLVGIALTAWLLPAFTKQWDDRQKAHQVQAELASEIAASSARIVIAASTPGAHFEQVDKVWLRDRVALDAKLGAYFTSSAVARAFDEYRRAVLTFYSVELQGQAMTAGGAHTDYPDFVGMETADLGMTPRRARAVLNLFLQPRSAHPAHNPVDTQRSASGIAEAILADALLAQEHELTRTIMHAHVAGYSTTTRDLLKDLLPIP